MIVLESDLPKARGFHTLAETTAVQLDATTHFLTTAGERRYLLRRSKRFAQFSSDRD